MKNSKARKPNTFSQPAVPSEVGEFQQGYFVIRDPTATNDNENTTKSRNNAKTDRSPNRRKQSIDSTTVSPNKERTQKKQGLLTPGSLISATKSPKIILSTSPTVSERWAGPAFGNAPPPSALPLPEFPPMSTILPIPPVYRSPEQTLSHSPPNRDYVNMAYPSSPYHPPEYSSIPSAPFPYVGHTPPPMPPMSLAQLSTDLKRMLNINEAASSPMVNDPVLVFARSS